MTSKTGFFSCFIYLFFFFQFSIVFYYFRFRLSAIRKQDCETLGSRVRPRVARRREGVVRVRGSERATSARRTGSDVYKLFVCSVVSFDWYFIAIDPAPYTRDLRTEGRRSLRPPQIYSGGSKSCTRIRARTWSDAGNAA